MPAFADKPAPAGAGPSRLRPRSRGRLMPSDHRGRSAASRQPFGVRCRRGRPRGRPQQAARTARAGCLGRAPRSGRPRRRRGRTSRRPCAARHARGRRPTSRANGRMPCAAACSSASASRDLPEPDGPRISTARAPTSTAEAWMVGMRSRSIRHRAGRRTMKRAPEHLGGSSSSDAVTAMRFSAQSCPPCASTICLEIDRPRPEFWPKP